MTRGARIAGLRDLQAPSRARRRSARSRSGSSASRPAKSREPSAALDGVPAHVRARSAAFSGSTVPGHSSRPSVSTPCSMPRAKRICMPTQMPRTGRPPASRRSMIQSPRASRSPSMQAANAPTPGTSRPSAFIGRVVVAGDLDVGARRGEGALGGADVAEAVVEDDDLLALAGRAAHSQIPLSPQDPGDQAHRGADARAARSTPLGSFCLPEGDDAAERGRARRQMRSVDRPVTARPSWRGGCRPRAGRARWRTAAPGPAP